MFQVKDTSGRALVFARENVDCIIVADPSDLSHDMKAIIRGKEYVIHADFADEFVRDYMRGGPSDDPLDAIAENIDQLDNTLVNIDENVRGLAVAVEGIERW